MIEILATLQSEKQALRVVDEIADGNPKWTLDLSDEKMFSSISGIYSSLNHRLYARVKSRRQCEIVKEDL